MAIYGIGYNYRDEGNLSKEFLSRDIVCISSRTETRRYFLGMFDEIKKDDIVILKTKNRIEKTLIIRAIGIVKDSERSENEFGYCKKVRWLDNDPEGVKTIQLYGDGGVQRNTRIYREYNPDIIKQIDELVEKYKKEY